MIKEDLNTRNCYDKNVIINENIFNDSNCNNNKDASSKETEKQENIITNNEDNADNNNNNNKDNSLEDINLLLNKINFENILSNDTSTNKSTSNCIFNSNLFNVVNEKNKILEILKLKVLNNVDFKVKKEMFNISYIKNLINQNIETKRYINSIKDKINLVINNNNKNVFFIIKNIKNKLLDSKSTKLKDNDEKLNSIKKYSNTNKTYNIKLLLCNYYHTIQLLLDEPSFIIEMNKKIYNQILLDINSIVINNKYNSCVHLINGVNIQDILKDDVNSNENTFINEIDVDATTNNTNNRVNKSIVIKNFVNFKSILSNIYTSKSKNLINNKSNIGEFNFRLKIFDFSWYIKIYSNLIKNIFITDEISLNDKKRREIFIEYIKEKNRFNLRELCISGIPPSLRKEIYMCILNIDNLETINKKTDNTSDTIDFEDNPELNKINNKLNLYHEESYLAIDYIINEDIKIVADSESFFLQIDKIYYLIRKIIRDPKILTLTQSIKPLLYINSITTSTDNKNTVVPFPPSGIIPYQGICYQCGVFTYLSKDENIIYSIYSIFYSKYLCKINSYSTDYNSLLSLLYNLNNLVYTLLSELNSIFIKYNFDINEEVIRWFYTSFGELLSIQDIFIIYDIILLSESNHIFVLVAFSIINYKKESLYLCNSKNDIINCLNSIKYEEIRIVELINNILE